jgi:hypothetical protein
MGFGGNEWVELALYAAKTEAFWFVFYPVVETTGYYFGHPTGVFLLQIFNQLINLSTYQLDTEIRKK